MFKIKVFPQHTKIRLAQWLKWWTAELDVKGLNPAAPKTNFLDIFSCKTRTLPYMILDFGISPRLKKILLATLPESRHAYPSEVPIFLWITVPYDLSISITMPYFPPLAWT